MILYCLLSAFLNAAASLVLGGIVFSKKPRDARTVTFASVTVAITVWSVCYLLWQMADTAEAARRFSEWFSAAAILIPVLYFHFATSLAGQARRREVIAGYVLTLPFVPLSFTEWIVAGVRPKLMFPYWPDPGPLYPAYLAVFFYFLLRSWHVLYAEYRISSFLRRNQLRYVLAYTVAGYIGGATNFPLWYDLPVLPAGNILVGAYMVGVGYAVVRFRLMEFDLLVAKVLVYSALIGALAALTPALSDLITRLVPLRSGYVPMFTASLLVTALLFWLIPVLRRRLDAALEQRVLGRRLADRELLRSLSVSLSSAQGEEELFREAVTGIADALDVADVAVHTRTEFETDFTCRANLGGRRGAGGFPEGSPLVRALSQARRGVLLDELAHSPEGEAARPYFAELRRRQGLELAVPVIGDTFFYGFITLGPRAGHVLYTEVDISLLEAIGLQIGLNLRARQLERRASQTEKLIALGTLAAGLAHELRNPLTSVQTFSALLRETQPDAESLREFSGVVQRDVNRIAAIVKNVAAFAESNKVDMTRVALDDLLRTTGDLVRPELARAGATLVLPEGELPAVQGNHSQLLQVFVNLVQNAVQALEGRPGPRITVSLDRHFPEGPSPLVCLSISDNGPGIDPALLPHIFEPFTTTKATGQRLGKGGMGLGLAIVKRIVQHHHGEINVTSTPGRGTTFRIYLPLTD